jgi:hypothetical protein
LVVERECQIRKTLQKYMNKTEHDFPSLRAYNDYLELLEDYTFKLLNEQNVQQVYMELEQFRVANKEVIQKNIMRQMQEEKFIQELIEAQEQDRKRKHDLEHLQQQEEIIENERKQIALVEELTRSDQPASLLLAKHENNARSKVSRMRTEEPEVWDPLKDCYRFPIEITFKDDGSVIYDPMTRDWIKDLSIQAGGCTSSIFHSKAIQSSFILIMNVDDHSS